MSTSDQTPPKSWVFVSHSNKDIDAVRLIRDELERSGHYPLLFFLKCINDDDELDQLITREIEARNFFLYCDSSEARDSKWVQRELDFIRALPNRVWCTVDLDSEPLAQVRAIQELSRRATVASWCRFISACSPPCGVFHAVTGASCLGPLSSG